MRAAPSPAAAASTSAFVIRPAGPLPETAREVDALDAPPRGAATGETLACRRAPAPAGGAGGAVAACRAAGASRRRAPAAGAAPPTAMRAITCPTVTVSPSATRISVTVPVAGRGQLDVDLVGRDLDDRVVRP